MFHNFPFFLFFSWLDYSYWLGKKHHRKDILFLPLIRDTCYQHDLSMMVLNFINWSRYYLQIIFTFCRKSRDTAAGGRKEFKSMSLTVEYLHKLFWIHPWFHNSVITLINILYTFFFIFSKTGFGLRAFCFLSKHSTTWGTPPTIFNCFYTWLWVCEIIIHV
jgi:hypothetical protein